MWLHHNLGYCLGVALAEKRRREHDHNSPPPKEDVMFPNVEKETSFVTLSKDIVQMIKEAGLKLTVQRCMGGNLATGSWITDGQFAVKRDALKPARLKTMLNRKPTDEYAERLKQSSGITDENVNAVVPKTKYNLNPIRAYFVHDRDGCSAHNQYRYTLIIDQPTGEIGDEGEVATIDPFKVGYLLNALADDACTLHWPQDHEKYKYHTIRILNSEKELVSIIMPFRSNLPRKEEENVAAD